MNEHNKDVIVEVVDGIGKIKLPDKNYGDVEVIIENADKADLKNAKEMVYLSQKQELLPNIRNKTAEV